MIAPSLSGRDRGRIPSRKVFYRIDANGKPYRCVSSPSLPCLLSMWGVRPAKTNIIGGYSRVKLIRDMELHDLSDLHERAKSVYLSRVASIHPDRGGDPELAIALNCAWDNTERLFRKRGLEI